MTCDKTQFAALLLAQRHASEGAQTTVVETPVLALGAGEVGEQGRTDLRTTFQQAGIQRKGDVLAEAPQRQRAETLSGKIVPAADEEVGRMSIHGKNDAILPVHPRGRNAYCAAHACSQDIPLRGVKTDTTAFSSALEKRVAPRD